MFVCSGDPDGSGLSWKVDSAGETADRTGETPLTRCAHYVGCKRVDFSVCPGVTVIKCELQGDGNVTDHRIQRRNFGPGQEDVSDSLGRRWTKEHETQLEVNIKHTPNKQTEIIFLVK